MTMTRRRYAIGDPQAPFETFRAILDRHGLTSKNDRLAADAHLVSIGDHFDWGGTEVREQAAQSGLELLGWLASHAPEQVTLILGNHDLGRVGELVGFEDEEFARVHREAVKAYRGGDPDTALEEELKRKHPALPTAELAARDFAAFSAAQRELVIELLRTRRFRAASAVGPRVLLCHAGLTTDYLDALDVSGRDRSDAHAIAAAVSSRLDEQVDSWTGGPLSIPDLHTPGSAAHGEGVGMFYHRPANPVVPKNDGYRLDGVLQRRLDPRKLPLGLTQVVGHIGDSKCRQLLGEWAADDPPANGAIRHLVTDGVDVRYAVGAPPPNDPTRATMVFIDGTMSRTPADTYAVLDLATLGTD